jgi:hypothetical protein
VGCHGSGHTRVGRCSLVRSLLVSVGGRFRVRGKD